MPTVVNYNGITLNSVLTKRFDQTPIYDASGTDVIASKFSMSFQGVCHAQGSTGVIDSTLPYISNAVSAGDLPSVQQAYTYITQALWVPRAKFTCNMGGQMILVCNPCDSGTQYDDVENGPKPKRVELSHITSNNTVGPTFHVSFEIELVRTACPQNVIQAVLSNRWSISEGFDDEYYTTRSITGEMRLSSAALDADSFRYLVVPALEPGFKRASIHWNIAADGLKINYVVTDKQVETAPPWPAAKMHVRHSEGTGPTGQHFESECHVSLEGFPGADKIALFALAVRIIENRIAKFSVIAGSDNNTIIPVAFSMVDVIGERNELEVYLKVQYNANATALGAYPSQNYLGLPIARIGVALDQAPNQIAPVASGYPATYSTNATPVPNPWGYNPDGSGRQSGIAKLHLQCYLQYPCNELNRWIYQQAEPTQSNYTTFDSGTSNRDPYGGNQNTGGTNQNQTPNPDVYDAPSVPPYSSGSVTSLQNTSASTPVFTHAAGETTIIFNPLRAQLPIAGDPTAYNGTDDTSVIITFGFPQACMKFHIESECPGKWPFVPEPMPSFTIQASGGKITGTLLSSVMTPMPPTTDATATKKIYHVTSELIYALSRPPKRNETIPIGVLQWTSFKPTDTALQLSSLYDPSVNPWGTDGVQQGTSTGPMY